MDLFHRLFIADSTENPHSEDTRPSRKGKTGMGTGYIRMEAGMKFAWSDRATATFTAWAARPTG